MSEHPNLAAALVAALAELTVVDKNRHAKIEMKTGGSYSYEYADITDVIKLTRPVLAEHGLVVLTPVHAHGDGLACTVKFLHTSGESMDLGPFPFPHGRDAQATGSMVTYHRRYALVAALGMAAGDDDDGAAAAPRQKPAKFSEPVCPRCGELVRGEGREPMRAHLVAEHDFVRQEDGTVVAPKVAGEGTNPSAGADEPSPADKRKARAEQVLSEADPAARAAAMAERTKANDKKLASTGER